MKDYQSCISHENVNVSRIESFFPHDVSAKQGHSSQYLLKGTVETLHLNIIIITKKEQSDRSSTNFSRASVIATS